MIMRFLAPELSAQLSVAATGSPRVILSFTPTAPVLVFLAIVIKQYQINLKQYFLVIVAQMLSFLNNPANLTNFNQCRMLLTAPDLKGPDRFALHKLMQIFNSEDVETKAQIAFATLVNQIQTSEERNNWLYLIKNLIILDRLVDQQLFLDEIFALSLPSVDNFKENKSSQFYDSQRKVKMFWKTIKQMSGILVNKRHIFCFKRSQRMDFSATLTPSQVLQQMSSIQQFFRLIFEFAEVLSGHKLSHQNNFQASKIQKCHRQLQEKGTLFAYLYLQIFRKFTLCYSCQLQCNKRFLRFLSDKSLGEDYLKLFMKIILKFKDDSNKYIAFIKQHKQIAGIEEINDIQLNSFQIDDMVQLIEEFIKQREDEANQREQLINKIYSPNKIKVERSPLSPVENSLLVARLPTNNKKSSYQSQHPNGSSQSSYKIASYNKEENRSNVFFNWDNAYSDQFPQNDIMTVDLILILKAEERSEDDEVANQYELNRSSCDCKLAEMKITSVGLKSKMKPRNNFPFQNVFSGTPMKWNFY